MFENKTYEISRWHLLGAILAALVVGIATAVGGQMYRAHNLQHAVADNDHKIVTEMLPIVQSLYQIELKRQQANAPH